MFHVYGLKNCDKCRAALRFMKEKGLEHRFHDIRAEGLDPNLLDRWLAELGWEELLNRKSTTWRGLSETDRQDLDLLKARELILSHPTLAKRPVIECNGGTVVGFNKAQEDHLMAAV